MDPSDQATRSRRGRTTAAHHVPGLVAIFPLLTGTRADYSYGDIQEFVAARAASAGLAVVDLRTALAADSLADLALGADDVLHLDARGHEASARALRPCVESANLHCRSGSP